MSEIGDGILKILHQTLNSQRYVLATRMAPHTLPGMALRYRGNQYQVRMLQIKSYRIFNRFSELF